MHEKAPRNFFTARYCSFVKNGLYYDKAKHNKRGEFAMLKKFEVKNYRNFKDTIEFDLSKVGGYQFSTDCLADHMIGKALIYGRNATGKTNFGSAIFDITYNIGLVRLFRFPTKKSTYLNADSMEKCAEFKYCFQFGKDELIYRYRKTSEMNLCDEELILNGDKCFYYNFLSKEANFDNLKALNADTIVVERYLETVNTSEENEIIFTVPFLRWLINNTTLPTDSVLFKLETYVKEMVMLTVGNTLAFRTGKNGDAFFESLEDKNALNDFQEFLNAMGVECELVLKSLPDGERELYFKHKRLVPFFENVSSGTMALYNLYRRLAITKNASFLYIDEFDAFYHYEMADNVVKYFKKKYPQCQVIMTTHNTNLMTNRLMRPDCLFILSRNGKLTALCDATPRELREGHNLEKLYISGEFGRYE